MKFLLLILSVLFFSCVKISDVPETSIQKNYATLSDSEEILVKFKSPTKFNGKLLKSKFVEFYKAKVANVDSAISNLKNSPNVDWVCPNFKVYAVQSDPYFANGSLWGINNIQAPAVWNVNKGSQNVYVGLLDEGVMYWHEDLCGQIWTNPYDPVDGIDNDGNGYIDDFHGWDFYHNDNTLYDNNDVHGTHTAGTIGAKQNGVGVIGVSPNVTIIPAKFLEGSGDVANAILACDYITDLKLRHGLNIACTNNSWSAGNQYSQGLVDAINRAKNADILFVAAAGNNTNNNDVTPTYPASLPNENIISVAAIGTNNALATFSNYGATTVDISAPGVNIWSTTPSGYGVLSGTSMATPHVSGAVAIYKASHPNATWSDIKNAILNNARPSVALQGKCVTGGTLDISGFTTPYTEDYINRTCDVPFIDNTPPSVPMGLRAVTITDNSILFSWNRSTDLESAIANYTIQMLYPNGFFNVLNPTDTFVTYYNLPAGTRFRLNVKAKNTYNLYSAFSDTLFVSTTGFTDTIPPTVPTGLVQTAQDSTTASIAWNPSTDNVGVWNYTIRYRKSGTTNYTFAATPSTTLNFGGLTPATTYEVAVYATDAALNSSAWSNTLLMSTLGTAPVDTIPPPPPPISVTLTGQLLNKNIHSLNWTVTNATNYYQELQYKTNSNFTTLYVGNPPYAYKQPSIKNYYYRVLVIKNGVSYYSNQVILKSKK